MPQKYGLQFPTGTTDATIELFCFKQGRTPDQGGLGKFEHFKNATDLLLNTGKSTRNFVWTPEAEDIIWEACENKYLAVGGCASSGKCLAPNTSVLMYDGTLRRADRVQEGEQLMGPDSKPRTVLSTVAGVDKMVRIVPKKGDPWECTLDHVLTLERRDGGQADRRKRITGTWEDITVGDYLKLSPRARKVRKLIPQGVDFPAKGVSIAPRWYGMWLGDGHKASPYITVHDDETEVADYLTSLGGRAAPISNSTASNYRFTQPDDTSPNPYKELVKESVVEGNKRISPRYLVNSRQVRMEVLAGLIDSDGYSCAGTCYEIHAKQPGLKDDICYLARSLGFRVSAKERVVKLGEKQFLTWRISICGPCHEIPALRKKCRKITQDPRFSSFEVVHLGKRPYAGFTLSGDGRFLLGDFTVTHNSDAGGLWGWINYLCSPTDTMVLVTSTTLREARRRIWKSITEFWYAVDGIPGKMVDSLGQVKGIGPNGGFSSATGIVLVPAEKKQAREAIGKLAGIKQVRVLLIADELTELPESLVHVAYTNLDTNPGFHMMGLANPASRFDAFGVLAKPKHGWNSVSEADYEWETSRGKFIRFDASQCTNVMKREIVYPWQPTYEKVEQARADYGEKSPFFYRMFKAFFAPEGLESGIYSEADLTSSMAMSSANFEGDPEVLIALDPSFTHGGDRCMAYVGLLGNEDGLPVLQFSESAVIEEDMMNRDVPRNVQVARGFVNYCREHGVKPRNVGVDSTGGGGVFCDILANEWKTDEFMRVNFAGNASDRPVSAIDLTPGKDKYSNRMSELWFSGLELLRTNQLRGIDDHLARELTSRQYDMAGKKLVVEPKVKYKARTGESPDLADAAFVLIEVARERFGFLGGERFEISETKQQSWSQAMNRFNVSGLSNRELL